MTNRTGGVVDPRTGEKSWFLLYDKPARSRYWKYRMPEPVAEIVLES